MILLNPNPKDKSLHWFSHLHNYETSQCYVFNVTRRSISLAEILKDTRKWLEKTGLMKKRPFYAM